MTTIRILLACFALAAFSLPGEAAIAGENNQKAVLITGASTGLGRAMAELFAERGVYVYAGARKQADIDELNALDNIQAVKLDVTDPAQIDAAVKTVTEAGRGLHGLINNAGVAIIYPLTSTPEEEMQFQMDVNVFGPYRVAQAFAPLIVASKGRISTTGSISGILSGAMFGPYSMSKHAMEAYTDSLAREMEDKGVHVSIIEPGNYESKIGNNIVERMLKLGYDKPDSPYHSIYTMIQQRMADRSGDGDPAEVAEAAWLAMFEENPKRRYMVVPNQRQADITVRKAIEEMVQLNQRQKYTYSRDDLVRMLDEALEANP